ncbi:MAG: restriction endonuclease subunit S [Candidatus Pacebacteria bacterium]|nr:restriction endonuclease subunit S [Candidatus Paceibacterota bacterium]
MQKLRLQLKNQKFSNSLKIVKLKQVIVDIISGNWGKEESNEDSLLCKVLRGTDFSKAQDGFFDDVPTRFIKKESFNKLKLEQGDILIELSGGSRDQPTGRILIWRDNLNKNTKNIIFSNFVKKFKLDYSRIEPEYFYRYWQHLYFLGRTAKYEKRTTGIRNFKYYDFIENEKIPLPPLSEQKKIVYVLDNIQEVIRTQEKIIEKTKELKKTLLNEIFNSKIKNQKWIKLGDEKYFEIKLGGTPRTNRSDYWNGKIYWITPNDLNKLSSPHITRTERKITGRGLKTGSTLLSAKSIILSTRAPIGYLAILNEDMAFNQGCKGIIIKKPDEIFNLYLFYYLTTQVNKLKDWGSGSTFRELSTPGLKQFSIPLIDIKKQREIAEILQTIDQKIEIEQKKKALYEELFRTTLNKLMTGEIKVDNLKL